MKVRNILTGKIFEAELRTDHAASSYGQPVLVLKETGEAVDQIFFSEVKAKKSKHTSGHKR